MDIDPSRDAAPRQPERTPWMPMWLRVLWGVGGLLIVFLGGVMTGLLVERQANEGAVMLGSEWRDLGEAIAFLETDSYYRPEDPGEIEEWQEEVEAGAINGMLDASGDDWAEFLPPSEAAASSARLTGRYEGIGVSIGEGDSGDVEIMSVMLDSPASRADIRVGDVVAEVNATPIPTGDTDLAAELLRGEAGTDVSLLLQRSAGDTLRLELTREEVATGEKTVAYRFLPDREIGVIQITLFATTTVDEIDEALAQAREDGVTRLVLDLRGNPGGWVSAAQGVLGRFLPEDAGPALLEDTRALRGTMIELPITGGDVSMYDGELIVLVDAYTASAAEIVAGALQDYGRAQVVGTATFGKGSVQRVYEFPDGESLRLTIAEWFTPESRRLQDAGVEPDVAIDPHESITSLVPALDAVFEGEPVPAEALPDATPVATPT